MSTGADGRELGPPFAGAREVVVVVPSPEAAARGAAPGDAAAAALAAAVASIEPLVHSSAGALTRELGAPLVVSRHDPGSGPRFLIGPWSCNPALAAAGFPEATEPSLVVDRRRQLVVCDAPSVPGLWEAFAWLRALARFPDGPVDIGDCPTVAAAAERVEEEVGDSYPSFELRSLDWSEICHRHRHRPVALPLASGSLPDDLLSTLQAWLAELGDAHTWVRVFPPLAKLPYGLWVDERGAVLAEVPAGTPAFEAGVRAGDVLIGEDVDGWQRRVGASPHARPLVVGQKLLETPVGTRRTFRARRAGGSVAEWEECPERLLPWADEVTWRRLEGGPGYLRIRSLTGGAVVDDAVDAAFSELRGDDRLVVDLRGNPGGALDLAHRLRDRFVRTPTVAGSIRTSIGPGTLSEPEPLLASPSPDRTRWPGRVRFLTDPLTYSAAEDLLLGLQGLDHVQVVGQPSGGGSGRLRILRLLPGTRLTVSTALTYDRHGRCVENRGIQVDLPIQPVSFSPDAADAVLAAATIGW